VMNTEFGDPGSLPFDLRHRRFPITYRLPAEADSQDQKRIRRELANSLFLALRDFGPAKPAADPVVAVQEAIRATDDGAIEDLLDPHLRKLRSYLDKYTFDEE